VYFSRWRDDGHNPSFTVYSSVFRDYGGAGDSGDVYTFLQRELNLSFAEAVNWLRRYVGGHIQPAAQRPAPAPATPNEPPPAEWQSAARAGLEAAQRYLWSDKPAARRALAYLRTVRGLNDDTIRAAGYGYNPNWQAVNWRNPDTGRKAYLPPGIIEPWESDGALWALRVRCRVGNLADALGIPPDTDRTGEELPKYLNLAGSKQSGALYNGNAIQPGRDVLIVEGGFDAQLAGQILGPQVAVVTLGSATNTPTARRLAQLQSAGRVFLLLDTDEAGQAAQRKLLAALGDKAIPLQLPTGKDVTEFIVQHGGDLRAALASQLSPAWWPQGLPDTIRTALLTYFRDSTALVIEILNTAVQRGLIDSRSFTIKMVCEASQALGFNITHANIRRVLADLEGYFFTKIGTKESHPDFTSITAKNPGRPAAVYCLRSLDAVKKAIIMWAAPRIYEKHHPVAEDRGEGVVAVPTRAMLETLGFTSEEAGIFAQKLDAVLRPVYALQGDVQRKTCQAARRELNRLVKDLDAPSSTPLPPDMLVSNAAGYRAAFLRATNDPGERRSRKQIARLLGVAQSHVDVLLRRAGLRRAVKEGEYECLPLRQDENIVHQIEAGARRVHGFPKTIALEQPDGSSIEYPYFKGAAVPPVVIEQMAQGAAAFAYFQVANRYIPGEPLPPEPPRRKAPPEALEPLAKEAETLAPAKKPLKRRPYHGPSYDPEWVRDQFRLALLLAGRLRYRYTPDPRLFDVVTGEILEQPSGRRLLGLLLGIRFPERPDSLLDAGLALGGVVEDG
jgi:5S rRNA maturation endonuclease (ribonuclease M5)